MMKNAATRLKRFLGAVALAATATATARAGGSGSLPANETYVNVTAQVIAVLRQKMARHDGVRHNDWRA